MRHAFLLLLLLVGPTISAHAAQWSGSVGPEATVWLSLEDGVFALTFEERWEVTRRATALGSYTWDGETLEVLVNKVTFDGQGRDPRDTDHGFVIETPRKGVMETDPRLVLRPKLRFRLHILEDDGLLELRGNGGFELNLTQQR